MATAWKVGDRILNRWEIHKIVPGGMGVVYIVYDHEWHEAFAAKTFPDDAFTRNPAVAERFTREALAWVGLDYHPNITRACFVKVVQGKPFLFLEYVSGGDLGNWIGSPRLTDDLPQVLRFALDFCEGMIYAASKGIKVHRDIKPQNCLITGDRILKVTDFGLAKSYYDVIEEAESSNAPAFSSSVGFSQTGLGVGTASYMAPEQFDDAKHVDTRADVYSFGVMLFEMLTGSCPFRAAKWEELRWLHQNQAPPHLRTHARLNYILDRCLAKEADLRFADFGQICDALAAACTEIMRLTPKQLKVRKIAHLANEFVKALKGAPASSMGSSSALRTAEWLNKGASLAALGRYDEAITWYDRVLELNPLDSAALSNKGTALDALGWTEEAVAYYDRAIACDPEDAFAWSNKGDALREEGRHQEAIACYDRALELDKHHVSAWTNKAVALAQLGKNESAVACCDRAIQLDTHSEGAWTNKGLVLSALGRNNEAISCHEKAIEINPGDADIWVNKGVALGMLERTQEEIDCYDYALGLNPRLQQAWFNKGEALGRMGRKQEEIDCYEHALELDPALRHVLLNMGAALGALGRTHEEIDCYDRALQLDSGDDEVWTNKGMALADLGQAEAAINCYDHALKVNPSLPQAWYYKGISLGMLERRQEEIDCYNRAIGLDCRCAAAWFAKGVVSITSFGRHQEGLECLEEAKRLGDPRAAEAIALCRDPRSF
jgi:tetratricopeptide (TPR) repeat protein